jgi:solute carrier family 25 thiamine pyrophosphate transporter 19
MIFNSKLTDDMIAGAFAGIMARIVAAPFDVIKIRSQLQFDSSAMSKSRSIISSFTNIVKSEGFFALWKGNLSATYLWISYAVVQFAVYG